MKNLFSLLAVILITAVLFQYRSINPPKQSGKPLVVTTWDAFGYYMYLPAVFTYHDFKKLDWLTEIDKKYSVTGGDGWQAEKQENGNYVFKYLGGVAILEMPWFFIGDFVARNYGYPVDGFSPPYQYALGFGVLVYCLLAILLLRKILLRYFDDTTTAITLLLLCLASNFIQYAAVDNAQSHVYIFPLYVLVLFATIKWHERPKIGWAALIGYVIGLATISRPTEAIMVFIPIFWATQNKEAAKEKWAMVKAHRKQVFVAAFFGILGILPQLIYWKITSGSFIFDVGSKWVFLNPWFRVLFGFEKGWFIYTPVTLFLIAGMFFIRKFPFRKSVLWFCLLNIYIIIAWDDWRYGGSFSTRALMQSYPVFALPLGALVQKVKETKWKLVFYAVGIYLLGVNLFQTWQYDRTIIHYNDMNRAYYRAVYLNAHPTAEQMSLLDNNDRFKTEDLYRHFVLADVKDTTSIHFLANNQQVLLDTNLNLHGEEWLKIEALIKAPNSLWSSNLNADLINNDSTLHRHVRLFNAIAENDSLNRYAFYIDVPEAFRQSKLKVYLSSDWDFNGIMKGFRVQHLQMGD
ncbi:glycosyltransferase family 39 protein [Taibaiella soli]|uniref:Glycosyltransferase RgtA/B/C/D-like domain-containing protein n=1 Tax=Taibaiella soli TaxID=1649169 RepID=A0A2W2BYJ6_9BACT|nr:glycosyltransferase family 39 protein [Taibaiella soli]PZF72943.1 hypothetical protein DN068_11065 [Taibaiella soli]